MALRASLRIVNPKGLHARPSHAFVTCAMGFESTVRVTSGGADVNGKSILELMTLGAACGEELLLQVEGQDEEAALAALCDLVGRGFGE